MDQIKAGGVVQLKSGGPLMTVKRIEGNKALCDWFEDSKPQQRWFELTSLKAAE
jgi:uncharacterized protein YodC (DUF2158 family)